MPAKAIGSLTIEQMVRAVQRDLDCEIDGIPGVETWTAIYDAIVGPTPAEIAPVDDRSEKLIATLHEQVRPYARALVQEAARRGIKAIVTSGTRIYAEQTALYAQGRTKPGKIVTSAKAGQSWHNHGTAFDITIFKGSKPAWESPQYREIGIIGERLGLEWGGRFKSFTDEPHFQMRNGKSLAQAQALRKQGKTVFS